MAQSTVLAAAATAGQSSDIVVGATPVTVSIFGTSGGAIAVPIALALERKIGSNWQPVYDKGKPVVLDQYHMDVCLVAPGTYRVIRPVLTVSIGVATDTTA